MPFVIQVIGSPIANRVGPTDGLEGAEKFFANDFSVAGESIALFDQLDRDEGAEGSNNDKRSEEDDEDRFQAGDGPAFREPGNDGIEEVGNNTSNGERDEDRLQVAEDGAA